MNHLKAIAIAALALSTQARSAEIPTPKDGWVSWQIEAVEDAPAFCCWNWNDKFANAGACKLDGDTTGYGTRDHEKTDAARVYARFKDGKLDRLRTLAAACRVEAKSPIQALDGISTDDSARWLTGLTVGKDLQDDVLMSLGMHRGERAFGTLNRLALGDGNVETRKQAIFWLAELRGTAGADVTRKAMFGDKSAELRKHAAFAITLSKVPDVADSLIKLGNTDPEGGVRAQAWFWLANTGAPNAEQVITAALRKDPDDQVREEGIMALSQLPDERGTRALIALAEDRSLSQEQRKRAVFWLGQSESADALAYMDKVLLGNTKR